MSFKLVKGRPQLKWFKKTASTAYARDTLMAMDNSTGYLIAASATTDYNIGAIRRAVVSTDADYAQNSLVPVEVPAEPWATYLADVTTGSLAATDVGKYFNLTDAAGVNVSAATNKSVLCVGYISATQGLFILNANAVTLPAA
jgi:hypothetical protein